MRSAREMASELEELSNEYALMFEGVERDGQIDEEEAQLGQEYADEYRKRLLELRKEIRAETKAIREQYRYQRFLLKSSGQGTKAETDVQYLTLRQEESAALAPFQAVLAPIERALNEARLTRAAFAEVRDTLRSDPDAYVASVGLPAQAVNLSLSDELQLVLQTLNRMSADWRGLRAEAAARRDQPDYAPYASHLRGIEKGLQRALDDIGAVIELAEDALWEEEGEA